MEWNFSQSLNITYSPAVRLISVTLFSVNLTHLFTYILSNILEPILNRRSKRLVMSFTDVVIDLVVC